MSMSGHGGFAECQQCGQKGHLAEPICRACRVKRVRTEGEVVDVFPLTDADGALERLHANQKTRIAYLIDVVVTTNNLVFPNGTETVREKLMEEYPRCNWIVGRRCGMPANFSWSVQKGNFWFVYRDFMVFATPLDWD